MSQTPLLCSETQQKTMLSFDLSLMKLKSAKVFSSSYSCVLELNLANRRGSVYLFCPLLNYFTLHYRLKSEDIVAALFEEQHQRLWRTPAPLQAFFPGTTGDHARVGKQRHFYLKCSQRRCSPTSVKLLQLLHAMVKGLNSLQQMKDVGQINNQLQLQRNHWPASPPAAEPTHTPSWRQSVKKTSTKRKKKGWIWEGNSSGS